MMKIRFIYITMILIFFIIINGCILNDENGKKNDDNLVQYTLGFENLTNLTIEVQINIFNVNLDIVHNSSIFIEKKYDYETIQTKLKPGKYNVSIYVDNHRNIRFDIELIKEMSKYGTAFEIYTDKIIFGPDIKS